MYMYNTYKKIKRLHTALTFMAMAIIHISKYGNRHTCEFVRMHVLIK